jgi:exodeoxyribonuclease VII large subunit
MAIKLNKLSEIIKEKLPKTIYHIKGEVSVPKITGGHLYFTLKDESGKINCVMWKYNLTDEMIKLKNGDNIEIKCQLNFYIGRGDLNFILTWGKLIDNIGDLNNKFEQMKIDFKNKGYFDKKIKLPKYFKNIVIITSLNGAAIHDFIYTLEKSNILINYTTIDAQVQGSDCPKQIIDRLNDYDYSETDLVIITRGGGSKEDLWGFNDKKLIETVYNRDYPVLSAIGHMIDTTLLDYVSDISTPTPSLAAQYIVDYNKKYLDNIKMIKNNMKENLISDINNNLLILNKLSLKKNEVKEMIINKLETYKQKILFDIKDALNKLDIIKMTNNINISIYNKNNKLSFDEFKIIVNNNEPFTLVWNDIIININNYNK